MAERVALSAAIRAASKELPIRPERELRENLAWAAGSMVEAYQIGAEEAQAEIVARLLALAPDAPDTEVEDGDG